jgi:predicted nuclease of predicted toxin-antitoxin system
MNILVDAQLPRRLAHWFCSMGCNAIHTLDLPDGNSTSDATIIAIAIREDRVVITKDADFVNSFLVSNQPHKLLLISTGNISNRALEGIFTANFVHIIDAFDINNHSFIEITYTNMIVHH